MQEPNSQQTNEESAAPKKKAKRVVVKKKKPTANGDQAQEQVPGPSADLTLDNVAVVNPAGVGVQSPSQNAVELSEEIQKQQLWL